MTIQQYRLENLFEPAEVARDSLFSQTSIRPEVAIVLGSGIQIFDNLEDQEVVPYEKIQGFPKASVKGHKGEITLGKFEGKSVAIFHGRLHRYEGHPWSNVVFPTTLMHAMGIKTKILTNAAGGIHRYYTPGDLVLIRDHIYWQPVTQEERAYLSLQTGGGRMYYGYNPELLEKARQAAHSADVALRQGTYVCLLGPTYETHAELKLFSRMGGDIVGMSTIPEAIWAQALGMDVVCFSCVTNVTYDPSALANTSHEEVVQVAQQSSARLDRLLQALLRNL
ncbi:purine-nucleoside phosphorylase [bacterium (Candidatus Blackallbacteria) CG17_big_fil_post_rev_8_21_14_2_50_48_46]|uniref:Purine nucleoside phosphorylase n=1 Tax=bacterium (Candidatus Blackallbacteria) CG17_big_fil_post_rev_8_21_14_2_50_48_46 TaxID=2014261 RepID=A0A2M7FX77_9BACT|nr:MAG: purine-nucleoside phosphorylase [bacterium (Candidatus Blackallbacteria) CG18_big_fil_WC_8_21_14_2_50_49_26]PIW13824.1 MAG: purine-nucleoside phosphorylase [bacterium (Candidatus Blackallbacteria) CG17_big_fil_post_rev_8_21_14_2_50_48_46]PIW45050.1 MAG: purine-nucleoside phosphorylase [bacterium (Candidatus Blackallbacteria) CG13_big_fil_rev_8_21_14_2_50_49_14]